MKFLSLFSGIGAIDYGLERAGMNCIGQVECEPFALAVLEKHWSDVPRWNDVRHFSGREFDGSVELICGGFPCQDISVAGKGKQLEGARSGLWWEFHRIIGELRPAWVIAENVPALRNRGADDVLSSLEAIGYTAWPVVVGAWAVGAPHKRDRVWIVAHGSSGRGEPELAAGDYKYQSASERQERHRTGTGGGSNDGDTSSGTARSQRTSSAVAKTLADPQRDGGREHQPQRQSQGRIAAGGTGEGGDVADTPRGGLGTDRGALGDAGHADERGEDLADTARDGQRKQPASERTNGERVGACRNWPARPGEPQHEWEAPRLTQFGVGGAVDGASERLVSASDRDADALARFQNRNALKALGNAVVWQIPYLIGLWIQEAERERT